MTRRFLCLAMLALLAVSPAMLAMTCNSVNEGQGAAGIASDTLYDDSLCEIPGEGLAAVIGYLGLGYCERLGLELDVDAVYGSADKRVFELRGTFGTAVPRTFFLRGDTLSADGSCYASLTGAGNFLIRSEYAGCADTIGFDAVERMETAEQAVCRFQVFLEDSCAGSPGENAEPSCADVLADYFQGCYGYTEREAEQEASSVCGYLSAEDRACLTACSEFADDCNEFEECLASEGCFVS